MKLAGNGSRALVQLAATCSCGGSFAKTTSAVQPALLGLGDYGATQVTQLEICDRCQFGRVVVVLHHA